MEYANRAYQGGAEVSARSRPVVKGHIEDTRETLIKTRDQLRSMLARLRGHGLPEGSNGSNQIAPPDPDHIVFIGEQTVQLSAEVLSLTSEISEYV